MRGFVKATTVLSTLSALTAAAYYLGLLSQVGRMSQSGYFGIHGTGFILSIGLAAGFMVSVLAVRVVGRRNVPEDIVQDSTSLAAPDSESSTL